jgi:hypothetical protein
MIIVQFYLLLLVQDSSEQWVSITNGQIVALHATLLFVHFPVNRGYVVIKI